MYYNFEATIAHWLMGAIVSLFLFLTMITSLSLLERAKQGDAEAIAALMNDVLQVQEVRVKATFDRDCLQVMLKSPAILNQSTCLTFIQRGLLRLQPEGIGQVTAYGWRVGDAFPLWIATVSLEQDLLAQDRLAVIDRPLPSTSAEMPLVDRASESVRQPAQARPQPPPVAKQHSGFFRLGFVIVLMTMVYFVVAGV